MSTQAGLLPGTLDLLILKAVSPASCTGAGVLLRIQQISNNALLIEQGALYPRSTGSSIRGCSTPSGAPREQSPREALLPPDGGWTASPA